VRSDPLGRNDDRVAGERLTVRAGGHADASQDTPFALFPKAEDEERVLDDDARGFGKADGDPDIRLLSRSDLYIESCVGGLELRVRVLRIQ
jgi:hypothetical protein